MATKYAVIRITKKGKVKGVFNWHRNDEQIIEDKEEAEDTFKCMNRSHGHLATYKLVSWEE